MRAAAGLPLVPYIYRQAHPRAENPPRRTFGIAFIAIFIAIIITRQTHLRAGDIPVALQPWVRE
jgi:hypothetical protein